MNAIVTCLVSTYDKNPGLSLEEIADQFQLSVDTARYILSTNGSKRAISEGIVESGGSEKLFKKCVVSKAVALIEGCIDNDDVDMNIRFKAAELVVKEKIGAFKLHQVTNNITQTNIHLTDKIFQEANEARNAARNRMLSGSARNDVPDRPGIQDAEIVCLPVASEIPGGVCRELEEGNFEPA